MALKLESFWFSLADSQSLELYLSPVDDKAELPS